MNINANTAVNKMSLTMFCFSVRYAGIFLFRSNSGPFNYKETKKELLNYCVIELLKRFLLNN